MKIDRTFKGALNAEEELFDTGMCDGPRLKLGGRYLIYSERTPAGKIPSRGCTRSRAVEYADEDLKFLNAYIARKTTTQIRGVVRFAPDVQDDDDDPQHWKPLRNVHITLSSDHNQYNLITDAKGKYTISSIPSGQYWIEAELANHRISAVPETIELHPKGCFVANMTMSIDRRVQGVLRTENGDPVPGVLIEMIDTQKKLGPVFLEESDEEGRYVIDTIPPGTYYLGINIGMTPKKENPYAPVYYPNTPDRKNALAITFTTQAEVKSYDITLPHQLPLIKVQGKIVDTSGRPSQQRANVRIKGPGLKGQIERKEIVVDENGHFEFELCEGVRYTAFAFAGRFPQEMYSVPVEFIPNRKNAELVFVLNKSAQEFLSLRREFQTRH